MLSWLVKSKIRGMGDRFRDIKGKGSVCCGLGVISVGMRGRVLEGLRLVYLEGGVRG